MFFCFSLILISTDYHVYQLTKKKQVQNISTRIIVRQKLDDHKKIRLYKKHPGPMLFCVLVPNIEVVEQTIAID